MILYFNWYFYLCDTWRDFHIARKMSIMSFGNQKKSEKVRAIQHQTTISGESGSGFNFSAGSSGAQ